MALVFNTYGAGRRLRYIEWSAKIAARMNHRKHERPASVTEEGVPADAKLVDTLVSSALSVIPSKSIVFVYEHPSFAPTVLGLPIPFQAHEVAERKPQVVAADEGASSAMADAASVRLFPRKHVEAAGRDLEQQQQAVVRDLREAAWDWVMALKGSDTQFEAGERYKRLQTERTRLFDEETMLAFAREQVEMSERAQDAAAHTGAKSLGSNRSCR